MKRAKPNTRHKSLAVVVQQLVGRLPQYFEHFNPAMKGAYRKGAVAATLGQTMQSCPYDDHRKPDGRLSWSRAFIRVWEQGHIDASAHMQANANNELLAKKNEADRRHDIDMWADGQNKRDRATRDDDLAGQIEAEQRRW